MLEQVLLHEHKLFFEPNQIPQVFSYRKSSDKNKI